VTGPRTGKARRWLPTLVPAVLWLGAAVLMWRDWAHDPYDPALTGTDAYGHNAKGDLPRCLMLSLAELAAYYAFTWPWVRRRAGWLGLAIALGAMATIPWSCMSTLMVMHAGGVLAIHALWTWALCALILVEAGVAIRAALRGPAPSPHSEA
jgi:hypothetical protein